VLARKPRLVPKLQRKPDNVTRRTHGTITTGENRRHRRGVNSSGHGYGDGVDLWHSVFESGASVVSVAGSIQCREVFHWLRVVISDVSVARSEKLTPPALQT